MSGLGSISWKGWAALATFAVQNGFAVLIMRWSKVKAQTPYSSQVAVLMQEVAVKLPLSLVFYVIECQGLLSAISSILSDLRTRPMEWAQLAVPAVLYTIQNTLLYVGYANVEAAVGQVTYQTKILWTALFSILVLGKRLSPVQWLALVVLALGVVTVQGSGDGTKGKRKKSRSASAGPEQIPALGIGALVGAAVCTAFASVYFERMLKGASKPSLWLRNIQLAIYSSVIAVGGLLLSDDPALDNGWLSGFGPVVWMSVTWQALGGIIVAVTIKYADNILRGFAQAVALIIGAIGSAVLFDFHLTATFWFGVALAIAAVFLYGAPAQTPQELCEQLAGTNPCVAATKAWVSPREFSADEVKAPLTGSGSSGGSSGSSKSADDNETESETDSVR